MATRYQILQSMHFFNILIIYVGFLCDNFVLKVF